MLKAILFDLGGTLFDFEKIHMRTVFDRAGRDTYQFLESLGHTLPPYGRYFRSQIIRVRLSYLWSLLRGRDFNCFDLLRKTSCGMKLMLDEQTLRELAWRWYSPLTAHCSVADDVVPTLSRLRDRGYKLAIVSNTCIPGFVLDRHLELQGLLEFFPVRVYSSETGYRKPHPRIFRTALDAIGVPASKAVFVGDRVRADVVGARRAGMRAVLRHPQGRAGGHHLADLVVRRISELHQMLPTAKRNAAEAELPELEDLAYET